jgi:hypothetical protein
MENTLPITPVGNRFLVGASSEIGFTATEIERYYGATDHIFNMLSVAEATNQPCVIREVVLRLKFATLGDKLAKDLKIAFFRKSPTAPTVSAVYDSAVGDLIGILNIDGADANYVSQTVDEYRYKPDFYFETDTTTTAVNVYAVILSDEASAFSYTGDAKATVIVAVEQGT